MLLQPQEHNKIINGSITLSFIDGGGFCLFHNPTSTKASKKEKNFINSLKRGDRVITKSGMHGKVMELNDKDGSCVIETLAGKIKMEKSSLSLELSSKFSKNN